SAMFASLFPRSGLVAVALRCRGRTRRVRRGTSEERCRMSPDCPVARSEGLITEELDGELLVYDSESNMAHALDAEAAAVWRSCDGHSDTHTLAARISTSDEDVRNTLARLGELGLLQDTHDGQDGDTRRSALRKIGIAGAGVATISSILVPTAAHAGSCVQPG